MKRYVWVFSAVITCGILLSFNARADEPALSQKEVADLAKPSVVKIVQHVKGDAVIPAIKIDFTNLDVATDTGKTPKTIQIDEYLTGSGIIISPDGYILTNSHVVSYQTVKNLIVSDFIYSAIDNGYANLSEEEAQKVNANRNPAAMTEFSKKIVDFMLSSSKFNLSKTVSVLNPTSPKGTLEELANDGFPTTVISVNDNFFQDSRDAALLKIPESNLPSIAVGSTEGVSTGKKVFIYGYPSTAEVSDQDLLVPTFSEGSISAIKDSLNNDFKIFQTDAKISKGSSGGPLLDEQGRLIGLVTFITSDLTKQDGDSFAFAIPIDEAQDIVKKSRVTGELPASFRAGAYDNHFLTGLDLLHSNRCKKALSEFGLAKQINQNFPVGGFLASYAKQCEEIISSGKSVDTPWDFIKSFFKDTKYLVLIIAGAGIILIAVLAYLWFWLFRRMKYEARELDNVEDYLNLSLEDGKPEENKRDFELPDSLKPK